MSVIQFPGADVRRSRTGQTFTAADPIADVEQRRSALETDRSWIVEAPAGSGKTGLLVQRMLRLLAQVDHPSEVLAVTFTNKATAEMRTRVLEALHAAEAPLSEDAPDYQREIHQLARAVLERDLERGWHVQQRPYLLRIRTMDALCAEITRALPILSGGTGRMQPIPDASELHHSAARTLLQQLGGSDATLTRDLETVLLHRDADLHNCEALIAEMLRTREQWGELVPLSGEELTDAYLDTNVRPRLEEAIANAICSVLCILHARFPEDLLRQLASVAKTLAHAEGSDGGPSVFLPCANFSGAPGTSAEHLDHWRLLAALLLTSGDDWRKSWDKRLGVIMPPKTKAELKEVIAALQADDELRTLLCEMRVLPDPVYPEAQWKVAKALFRLLRLALVELDILFAQEEVCDFTHIALGARSALRHGAGNLQEAIGTRVQHLLVDEMQDTSSGQYELLELLTEGWDGHQQTVFLVGDPKQSIYLFRQARVERFQASMSNGRLGSIPLGILRLSTNFRSGSKLVSRFNEIFEQVFPSSQPAAGDVLFAAATAALPASPHEDFAWHVTPLPYLTGGAQGAASMKKDLLEQEAARIVELAAEWRSRPRPDGRTNSIAVLTRARSHVTCITQAFAEAGIPFRAVEMEELGERQEVLDALAITRALLHPADRTAWLAALHAPWCGASLTDLHRLAAGDDSDQREQAPRLHFRERLAGIAPEFRPRVERTLDVMDHAFGQMGRTSMANVVESAWQSLGGPACTDSVGRENVRLYLELLDTMEGEGTPISASTLSKRLKKLYASPGTAENAVDVMTIHKAKGLEWDVVFLPGMQSKGKENTTLLLDWMELPSTAGPRQVLLAPIHSRDEDAHPLNAFLSRERRRRLNAELKRLFYVAATRARTALYLFASPKENKDGQFSHNGDTLFGAAWAAVPEDLRRMPPTDESEAALALAAAEEEDARALDEDFSEGPARNLSPMLLRLPLQYDPASVIGTDVRFVAPPVRQIRPFERPQGSFGARAVGNAIHAGMERLVREVAERMQQGQPAGKAMESSLASLAQREQSIRATLRAGGIGPESLAHALEITMSALRNALTHDHGQWLLLPHAGSAVESAWRAEDGGSPVRVRLDRSFFAGDAPGTPENGTLWIVDFKTGNHDRNIEQYLAEERARYEPQLRTYAQVRLQTLPATTPVMLALYFPLMRRLEYWRYTPESRA